MITYGVEIDCNGSLFSCDISNNGSMVLHIPVQDQGETCTLIEDAVKRRLLKAISDYIVATGSKVDKIEVINPEFYVSSVRI